MDTRGVGDNFNATVAATNISTSVRMSVQQDIAFGNDNVQLTIMTVAPRGLNENSAVPRDIAILCATLGFLLITRCAISLICSSACVSRARRNRNVHLSSACTGRNDVEKNYKEIGRECDYDSRRTDLLGDVITTLACFVAAIFAFPMTSLLAHPFSTLGDSALVHYICVVSTAHLIYRLLALIISSFLSGGCRYNWLNLVLNYSLAVAIYTTVIVAKDNAMLAVVGICYQVTFPLKVALRLVFGSNLVTSSISLLLTVIMNLFFPLFWLPYSMTREHIVDSLSLWSTGVFSVATVYFGLYAIWTLCIQIMAFKRLIQIRTSPLLPLHQSRFSWDERSRLFSSSMGNDKSDKLSDWHSLYRPLAVDLLNSSKLSLVDQDSSVAVVQSEILSDKSVGIDSTGKNVNMARHS